MSETPLEESPELRQWDAETFGEHLAEDSSAGQVFVLEGLTLSHLHRDLPELRSRLAQANIPLFTLDPTGVGGTGDTFVDILYSYVEEVEQRGKLSEDAQHLFEFVSSARDKTQSGFFLTVGGKLYNDTLCRLWTSLSRSVPAVLVVLNGHRLPTSEASVVEHLCTYFYSDPVEEFAPEASAADYANGTLVFLDNGMEMPFELDEVASQRIDLRESAEDSVREFLSDPNVIEKFVRSTGGDPYRLGELVESLPDDVENFWLFRYDRLEALQKRIVELLVVAEEAISADTLHAALEAMGKSEYFARSLRELTDNGFIKRKISSGVVRLQVASSDFSHAVRAVMSERKERECHAALAEAETKSQSGDRSAHFLARHYLAAGDAERGLEHGMEAAKQLVNERAYDRARELLETLEDYAEDDVTLKQIHAWSIDVHTALGHYSRALSHCERAREFAESDEEKAQLLCDIGRLLIETGEYEEAEERFETAVEASSDDASLVDIRIQAKLGQGESLYSRGEHAGAEELAMETVESVQTLKASGASSTHTLDLSLIHARNLIGKISLYRGRFDKARRLFEENRALAREWGWSDELARAEANLGILALQERDLVAAQDRLEAAQSIACSPVTVSPAQTWLNLGMVHQHRGRFDESLDYYLKSIRSARQSGDTVVYDVAAYNLVTL
ncbi:MAG: tetratricopeptide repeat protein, partial [Myxococcota bacterium]